MCRYIRVLEIESFMKHFLNIMSILKICDFTNFLKSSQYFDTPILLSVFLRIVKILYLIRGYKHN